MLRIGLCAALLVGLLAGMLALAQVAGSLSIDYFDAYEYLGNARVLAEGESSGLEYRWRRPPLLPLLQAAIYPTAGGLDGALAATGRNHWLAWGLALLALLATGVHLRERHGMLLASLGVALVAANPMFLHLVPFGLVDIPALLFTVVALDAALRTTEGSRAGPFLWALGTAAAMLSKYNLLLLGPVFVLFGLVTAAPGRRLQRLLAPRFTFSLLAAFALWFAVHLGIAYRIAGLSFENVTALPRTLLGEVGVVSAVIWDDPASEYLQELYQVTPFLLIASALLGAAMALRSSDAADRLHLLWLASFLAVMSLLVGSKSSRYLLPALPSLVHLQLRGLRFGAEWSQRWVAERAPALASSDGWRWGTTLIIGLLVLALPARQALHQLRHFEDPVYRSSFVAEVARQIDADTPTGTPIFWRNAFYTLVPEERLFFPHDETFYYYHFGPTSLEALLGRRISSWPREIATDARSLAERLATSCVRIDSAPELYLTHRADRMPEPPEPLAVDWIERRTLHRPADARAVADDWQRFAPRGQHRRLEPLRADEDASEVEAIELVRIKTREFRFP